MAKDPAFLFYPGDASEDTQFMNRLERGCYFDLLKAQKKFGRFTLEQIKKVLGGDFEKCWSAIELILFFKDGFYCIEWVNDAIEKRKSHVKHQQENGKKGGRPRKENPIETQENPQVNIGLENKKPLENEIVNENTTEIENVSLGGAGDFSLNTKIEIPKTTLEAAELNQLTFTKSPNTYFIKNQWKIFLHERVHDPPTKKKQYREISDLTTYFLNWIRTKHPQNGSDNKTSGKNTGLGKSAGAMSIARSLAKNLGLSDE